MKTNFIDSIHLGDSVNVLDFLIENDVKVNLTVTSPPYDDLRSYGKTCEWNFETFKEIANKLYKITEDGGILVWIVGDATIKGYESLSSFKQAIYFDSIGFKINILNL